jgi:type I restriction enzyme S subunit
MSFPRYERYKESGVGWLGEVPEHWDICRSRRLFAQRKERVRDSDEQLTASQKHGIVTQEAFMQAEGRAVVRVIHGAEILKHVEPDDFVISMRSFQGGLEWSAIRGCISSAYVMLAPSTSVYPGFFRHLFKSDLYIQALQTTSNLVRDGQAMRFENFTLIDLPLPSLQEQQQVALFLERELKKIEELIEEQRHLIELLKEKRQSVISHIIKVGLTANTAMKKTDDPWFIEMPAHWNLRKTTQLFSRIGSGTTPKSERLDYYEDGTIPWLNTGDLNDGLVKAASRLVTPAALIENPTLRLYPSGSLVMAMYGATIGKLGLLAFATTVNQACCVFAEPLGIDPRYVFYCFWGLRPLIVSLANGGGQPNISQDILKKIRIPVPPYSEQFHIVDYLEVALSKDDATISEAERAIHLLHERRSALISAAVTGKIDVRNYTPRETA